MSGTSTTLAGQVEARPGQDVAAQPMAGALVDLCFGSLADISERTTHVRFTSESGHAERQHRRPLSANSGPS